MLSPQLHMRSLSSGQAHRVHGLPDHPATGCAARTVWASAYLHSSSTSFCSCSWAQASPLIGCGGAPGWLHHRSAPTCLGQSGRGTRCAAAAPAATAAVTAAATQTGLHAAPLWANLLFSHVTVCMVCMYGLMVFAPRTKLTSALARSDLLVLALSLLAGATLVVALQHGLLQQLTSIVQQVVSHPQHMPDVNLLGDVFRSPLNTLAAWMHLLTLDFCQARYVWLDGLSHGVPISHSVALCFFVGPLGVLSHIITCALTRAGHRPPHQGAHQARHQDPRGRLGR